MKVPYYERQEFRKWLSSQEDQPFCEDRKCPLSQYLEVPGGQGFEADEVLAMEIDLYCQQNAVHWGSLTPQEVINILDHT